MSIFWPLPSAFSAAAWVPAATPSRARGEKAAREFEAQLIGTVLESLEKSFATLPGRDSIAGQDDYNYMGTQALAAGLVAGGGFGIAKMIAYSLDRSQLTAHQGPGRTK